MLRAATLYCLLGTFTLGIAAIRPGRAFDRFLYVILENEDFANVEQEKHFKELAAEGVLLDRFFALTHPSQPNYIGAIAGDYFGLNHGGIVDIPEDVHTVVDLLEARNVSWKGYFEDIPSPGYMGPYSDGSTSSGWDYVRKHNPFVSFESISHNGAKLWNLVGFQEFREDLETQHMPQFVFVVPNMMHDGHNTTLSESMAWTHDFLKPLLTTDAFDERTLIMLTYDECDKGSSPNQVATLLLGSAIPSELRGTRDNTFYTHYSMLSTVEFNWGLPNLGRYDVGANVFKWALDYAGELAVLNREPPNAATVNNSVSYPGPLNNNTELQTDKYPPPNFGLIGAGGERILEATRKAWRVKKKGKTPYDGSGEVFDGDHVPVYGPQL